MLFATSIASEEIQVMHSQVGRVVIMMHKAQALHWRHRDTLTLDSWRAYRTTIKGSVMGEAFVSYLVSVGFASPDSV